MSPGPESTPGDRLKATSCAPLILIADDDEMIRAHPEPKTAETFALEADSPVTDDGRDPHSLFRYA